LLGVLYLVLRMFSPFLRVPHIRLKADYGVEDIVMEAKSPRGRVREQVKKYMKRLCSPRD
jgi:hypothetical protein